MPTSGSILGNPVLRKEDPGILEGTTQYYDDLAVAGLLHVAFVRSTVAHANIAAIDTSDAASMPGVVAVYTADDLDLPDRARLHDVAADDEPAAARHATRCASSATSSRWSSPRRRRRRVDAAEAVIVDYDQLPAVVDHRSRARPTARRRVPRRRVRTSRTAWAPGRSKACSTTPTSWCASASSTSASRRCRWSRPASSSCPASPTGGFSFWVATQGPHGVRDEIAVLLGLDPAAVRGANAAVGGGFGAKAGHDVVEHLLVAKAALAARPAGEVDRDALGEHGRDVARPWARARRRARAEARRHDHRPAVCTIADAGAYAGIGAFLPFFTQMMAANVYVDPEGRVQLAGGRSPTPRRSPRTAAPAGPRRST